MAATTNPTAGSTVASAGTSDVDSIQYRNYRAINDGSFAQMTTTSGDWGYASLTASGNTQVKTGAGQLHTVICGTATGNISLYDGTSANGNTIWACGRFDDL